MATIFHIPGFLRTYTGGSSRVEIDLTGATVADALDALWALHPGVRDRVLDERGQVRQHVNLFVGTESIRYTGGFATPVTNGAEITIVPAVSGGGAVSSFLFKTEPSVYSFADLKRDRRTTWNGVSNALALIHLRKVCKGDMIVIYHTADQKSAVGLAAAVTDAYADPALDDPKRAVVDLKPLRALIRPVPLTTFKTDPVLRTVDLVRISRLSVMPLTAQQLKRLLQHADTDAP